MKTGLRRGLSCLLCLVLLLGAPAAAAEEGPEEAAGVTLGIFSTAGLGGRYYGEDLWSGEPETGYLQAASAIAAQRAGVDASLLIDCGGALAGVPYGGAEEPAYAPAAAALRAMGYDCFVPGLEEFRLTPAGQKGFFSALSAKEDGAGTPVTPLSANYLNQRQSPQLTPYQVVELTAGSHTFKIGVLGLGGMDVPGHVPEYNYAGASFAHRDNTEGSYAWEWANRWQARLREDEGCDLVIVALHGDQAQVEDLIASTTGIDLVLGGPGCPAAASACKNQAGVEIPWAGSGGSALTRTLVTLRAGGTLSLEESGLVPLSEYGADPELEKLLSGWLDKAREELARPLARLAGDWGNTAGTLYAQSREADLVCQAMCWAAGADLALLSPARLGDFSLADKATSGEAMTLRDCRALYPHGDSGLYAVRLTGGQLKAWLEAGTGLYQVDPDTLAITGGEGADILYGLDCQIYLEDGSVRLTWQGQPVEEDQFFTVAVDGARLDVSGAGDPYGWYRVTGSSLSGEGIVWSGPASLSYGGSGGAIPSVLAAYMQEAARGYGVLSARRESRWTLCPGALEGPITRLELVAQLYELAGCPLPGADSAFTDVTGNNAVVWAAEAGVVSGNGAGKFLPAQSVTREQAAVMLASYARGRGLEPAGAFLPESLADYGDIAPWARSAVEFCCRTGILPGLEDGAFHPAQALTRTECDAVLQRLAGLPPRE